MALFANQPAMKTVVPYGLHMAASLACKKLQRHKRTANVTAVAKLPLAQTPNPYTALSGVHRPLSHAGFPNASPGELCTSQCGHQTIHSHLISYHPLHSYHSPINTYSSPISSFIPIHFLASNLESLRQPPSVAHRCVPG